MVEVNHQSFAVELLSSNLSVNLTHMSKPFGRVKEPDKWLRTKEAKEYITRLSVPLKCGTNDLIKVKKGGNAKLQGTWCYDYRIAMRFAQWLNTDFAIAVDDLMVRLLTQHATIFKTALPGTVTKGIARLAANINGRRLYPYRHLLLHLGVSYGGGAYARRHRYPNHFIEFNKMVYCTEEMAGLIYANRQIAAMRKNVRNMQPVLPLGFGEPLKLGGF